MTPEVWIAVISTFGLILVAIVNGITLVMVGRLQVHATSQSVATAQVQADVARVEHNTNDMSTRLENMANKAGIVTGRAQVVAEKAANDKSFAEGKASTEVPK